MTASASPRSAMSIRVAMGSALRPTSARMIGGWVERSRPAGGCTCARSSIIIGGPSIWPAGRAAARAGRFAGQEPAGGVGAAGERLGELPVARDVAQAPSRSPAIIMALATVVAIAGSA